MELKIWSNPRYTNNESVPVSVNFQSGVTMLIGSNGTGKTTLMNQINSIFNKGSWEKIDDNNNIESEYSCYYYNNVTEEKFRKQSWVDDGNLVHRIASTFENSEGQDIWDFLYYKLPEMGSAVRTSKEQNKKGIFILLDGLDSGLSLDKLYKLKEQLLDFIIDEETTSDFEVFLICSANSYEFIKGYRCIDVVSLEQVDIFSTYEDFENYMLTADKNNERGV